MIEKKSLHLNMILNAIKGIMKVIFPLITFPYISKVLSVENVGKYNFASSVVSYFALLAELGITTYAIREGAKIRDNQKKFNKFADEMFSINSISTILSYILLFILCISVAKLRNYSILLLILSTQIAFNTIGIEWVYSAYEDYAYMTIRSIAFQIVSLVLLFGFVHKKSDLYIYAIITVISSAGSNILNYAHARRYFHIHLTKSIQWKKHLYPILILFVTAITVKIYVDSDITILGFLCGDYEVGIYSVATKVYGVVKTILSSIVVVSIPRLASLIGENKRKEFNKTASDIFALLISVMLPAILGLIILRKEVVLVISNESYIAATIPLMILSFALIMSLCGWFWGQCILIPLNKEKIVFYASCVGALINIILNLILVPYWKQDAAAFTTLLAETTQFIWCAYVGRKYVDIEGVWKCLGKTIIGCIGILLVDAVTRYFDLNYIIHILVVIPCSVLTYGIIEIALKNESIIDIKQKIAKKISHRN